MIRRPPRSTLDRSSAASDVYKRQALLRANFGGDAAAAVRGLGELLNAYVAARSAVIPVSYTHLRAHETVLDLVCRLLLEKKHNTIT